MAAQEVVKPVLCVGLVCLDIINLCDRYPAEDQDMKAKGQRWNSGGNAANTSIVLSLIGRKCEFFGTVGSGMDTDLVLAELQRAGVMADKCVVLTQTHLPTSCVVINTTNGSRTIVHCRNGMKELCFEDFKARVDPSQYSWIHFESRNPAEYCKMVEYVSACKQSSGWPLTVSVEAEKPRAEVAALLPLADVLFVSKDYARYRGYSTMQEAVIGLRAHTKREATVLCAWGEMGAAASDQDGKVYECPAHPPPTVVDTLGAGDTFNGGVIQALSRGCGLGEGLTFACRLAGSKCGMMGFDGLKELKLL